MTMKRTGLSVILPAIAMLIVVSAACTPEACFDETNAFLKATFYDKTSDKATPPDSLTLFGIDMDSLMLYDREKGVKPALFPLDASSDVCSFVIIINNIADTIQFRYTTYPHLLSVECGYTFYHNIDTLYYTKNNIDHIYISKKNITTANEENIRIFY